MLGDSKFLTRIAILGLTGYAVAQGLQCLGLFYLPAVSVTFILNFTPVFVLVMVVFALGVRPTKSQLGGWPSSSWGPTSSSTIHCRAPIWLEC